MSEAPVQLIIAAFDDEREANAILKELKRAKRQKLIGIVNAAVLRKDQKGKLHITETADMHGRKGATLGGVTGAAIGLLAGPALVVPAAVGALVGGLAAKLRDSGFSDHRLEMVGEGLSPGSSAIVAVVEHKWVEQIQRDMEERGADLFAAALSADITSQLQAGHDVAYTALASSEGFAAGRIAVGEDEIEGGYILEDADGLSGSRFVATEGGFAVLSMAADEDEIAVAGMAGSFEDEGPSQDSEVENE
jgi:uncharacterized membrane protein